LGAVDATDVFCVVKGWKWKIPLSTYSTASYVRSQFYLFLHTHGQQQRAECCPSRNTATGNTLLRTRRKRYLEQVRAVFSCFLDRFQHSDHLNLISLLRHPRFMIDTESGAPRITVLDREGAKMFLDAIGSVNESGFQVDKNYGWRWSEECVKRSTLLRWIEQLLDIITTMDWE
jgi:hypothetical protein